MVDKVKALKIETPTDGTQSNPFPTETDPTEDYLATKGLAFENSDSFLAEKVGGVLKYTVPDCSYKPDYLANGDVNFVEIFDGATQTTINRRVRVDVTYSGDDPSTEVWKIYDPADGTTVLRTITLTHTFTGDDLTKTVEATT